MSDDHGTKRTFALDVVAIGALNLDYIISSSNLPDERSTRLSKRIVDLLDADQPLPEWGTETSVDERTVYAALEAVNASSLQTALGGSAFNAIHTIAQLELDLRLGYVGTAGRVPGRGLSSVQKLEALGVDHRYVFSDDDHLCGVCFSFTEDGDRTLLTHVGANAVMAEHFETAFDELVAYLTSARVVHVTSFLDDRTPARLLALLTAVKRANPATMISFDPGHVWCHDPDPAIAGLVALAD
jgi:sugar/nucleoside kinase (ribokinase family)